MVNIIGYSAAHAAGLPNPEAYLFIPTAGQQPDDTMFDELPDEFTIRDLIQHTVLCIAGLLVISGLIYLSIGSL